MAAPGRGGVDRGAVIAGWGILVGFGAGYAADLLLTYQGG